MNKEAAFWVLVALAAIVVSFLLLYFHLGEREVKKAFKEPENLLVFLSKNKSKSVKQIVYEIHLSFPGISAFFLKAVVEEYLCRLVDLGFAEAGLVKEETCYKLTSLGVSKKDKKSLSF